MSDIIILCITSVIFSFLVGFVLGLTTMGFITRKINESIKKEIDRTHDIIEQHRQYVKSSKERLSDKFNAKL